MSTESSAYDDPPNGTTITLTREGEWWLAKDHGTGVVSHGKSRQAALENLDEALDGYHGEGDPPSDDDLHELGIDPTRNTSGSLDDSEIFE